MKLEAKVNFNRFEEALQVVDAHTAGEFCRMVIGGFPEPEGSTIMPFGSEKTENATEWSHEQETIVPNHSKEIRPNDRKEEHDQTVAERAEVVSQEEAPDPELEAQERARKTKKTEKEKKRGLRL